MWPRSVLSTGNLSLHDIEVFDIPSQITQLLDREGGPINMFAFIINPNDFGQSVENLFYLSFLIRDGTCAMELSEETLEPMICTLSST